MIISPIPENAAFFEALASPVRLEIIQLLAEEDLNIKQLAEKIGVSSPIMIKHVQKLEDAGIVTTRMVKRNGSMNKICTLVFAEYRLMLDYYRRRGLPMVNTYSIPVGSYCLIEGTPTCGLATERNVIGNRDDPQVFWETERFNAQLLWFTQGYVEYRFPDYLSSQRKIVEIEISFEIASEAPDFADDWPSDITFYFNDTRLFTWTSPGDFGIKRGRLTPEWWSSNQYGLLKTIHIRQDGILMDDQKVSDVNLDKLLAYEHPFWSIRFSVEKDANNVGGLTLFGKKFGNHEQDIVVRTFFEKAEQAKSDKDIPGITDDEEG